ncbi:MAG: DegQ family serine endoprotease [Alphaproteobacteria bacterium]|nr:DegQ family serine endoprotease [Alphaproteobacteria bacterium]
MAQGDVPSLAPMLEKVLPGVVSIAVHGRLPAEENPLLSDPFFRRFFGVPEQQQPQEREFQAAGSGVVVDPARGYVITNNHVVEKADEITVILSDGRRLQATKVGTDPATDVAVIRIPADGLSGLPLGDSDKLRVGDYVVAVGNPFGLEQTVTSGIVSALGRTGLGIEGYESFIQTDASINPGNSGGALVNLRGELVGINSAIIGPSGGNVGIGFAIPINMARQVMEQLVAHGKVSRGQLGVRIQDLTPELAKALQIDVREGALVATVIAKSPAEDAGLQAGDVITAVNSQRVRNAADLRNRIGLLPVGSQVQLDTLRKGASRRVVARLAEAVPEKLAVPEKVAALAGVTLGAIEPGSPLYGHAEGAVILDVKAGSRAARAGLRAGDAIVGVNQQPVKSPEDVIRIASEADGELLLQVVRDGSALFIVIA